MRVSCCSLRLRFEVQRDGAKFGFALALDALSSLRRPLKRYLDHFAATYFTGCFDHQDVVAGRQLRQRTFVAAERQLLIACRTRRTAHAIDRHMDVTTGTAPPLAQILEPLLAFLVFLLGVVPDCERRRDALIGALKPHRTVRTVIFGY